MKKQLSIALLIIVAMFSSIAMAQDDETPSCNPLTQPCYAPPCEWVLIVVDGMTEEVCIVPDDGGVSWFGWL